MYHLKAYCFSARQSIHCIFHTTLQPSASSMNTQGTSNSSNSYSKQPKQFSMAKHSVFHSPGSRQEAATAQYSHQQTLEASREGRTLHRLQCRKESHRTSSSEIRFSSLIVTPPCWNQPFRALIKLPNSICVQIYKPQNRDLLRQAPTNTHLEPAAAVPSL